MHTMFRPSWAYRSSTPATATGAGVGVGDSGRGVGVGVSGIGVTLGEGGGVIVGTGVAVGSGGADCWLPMRTAMITAAIPKETSRIMAPRAASSCRPCRQFMLPSALNSGLGSYGHG